MTPKTHAMMCLTFQTIKTHGRYIIDHFYVRPMTMLSATRPVSFWAAIKVSKCISADWTKIVPQNAHEVVLTHPDSKKPGTSCLILELGCKLPSNSPVI
jgi:hypothetical protein